MKHDTALPTRAEDLICFALYSASHAMNRAYTPLLRKLGLTYPQYIALTVLWQEDARTISQISDIMRLDTGTLTPLLKRLESMGHIKREKGQADGRKVLVKLTAQGRDLKAHAPDITRCIINATGQDLEALDQLVATLSQLRDAVSTAEITP